MANLLKHCRAELLYLVIIETLSEESEIFVLKRGEKLEEKKKKRKIKEPK